MCFLLNGRAAIVTGATCGMGRATALHLASLGASISLVFSSSSVEADRLAAEINSSSSASIPRAIPIRADVSDPVAVRSVFDLTEQTFKSPPHIVVHSTSIHDPNYHSISSTPLTVFDSIMSVNARGAFLVLKEAANRVVRGGGGRIIALSSTLVAMNPRGCGAYTASKAAVEAMVKTLEMELEGDRITANCVAPEPAATDMFFAEKTEEYAEIAAKNIFMGRLVMPEDIAPFIGFLCSDEGELINGQVIRGRV